MVAMGDNYGARSGKFASRNALMSLAQQLGVDLTGAATVQDIRDAEWKARTGFEA